ncbi:type II toxin-antitoxin system HicB family antitoxin [uncultured Ruminococcus sp.]|uniref:type II toxin-antitoxin system HicB family antitoxin n=1 Tax=uncultured Ruminococcus sp. TaxID=165186 RepID=UPI0025F81CE3|nr:type II toxin-antitoxin system HicB family antitoxin [uncultured Ruminococcus sp.]
MKYIYPVCIYPGDVSGYTVIVPDLPGCVTEGETIAEALEHAVDAASGWVLDELEEGRRAPEPSAIESIKADEYAGGFVSIVMLDIDAYAEKYGEKAVRKNCTIPAWLNTAAENAHLNFSQVLQTALQEQLHLI